MAKTILHLSHTDIRCDSRILKELASLEIFSDYEICALGLKLNEGASMSDKDLNPSVHSLRLCTKIFDFLPRPLRYLLNFFELTLILTVKGVKLRPALVHCHDTLVLPAGWLIKLLTGSKLVYDAHELESDKNGQTRILSKGTLFLEKICWSKVDFLISVSQSILQWYDENLGAKDQALILNSPVVEVLDNTEINVSGKEKYFHEKYNIDVTKPVFVYVGILGEGRGIEVCLDAFADSMLEAHVVFLGYGSHASLVKSYSKRYPNIHLHPAVPHEQVVSFVKSADIGLCFVENVSLSDYYCLPNKLFEYCFSGVPVLGSDFPEIKRIVEKYQLGICCKPESESIRSAIRQASNNPLPAMHNDLSDLSWATQADRLQSSYRSLLAVD